jgi:3-hydroxyisobutyryl-CoA hydrolase
MTLEDVFRMEYKISQGFMNHHEFFEGVRALLVDKDKSPKWSQSSVFDVKKEDVDFFFNRDDELNLDISKF